VNLKVYFSILWGNKWVILITILITVGVVAAYTFLTTPIYSASTTLRVASASLGSVSYSDFMYADRLMNTYTRIATSQPVLDELKQKLSLSKLPAIKVTTISSTELFRVTVESTNPNIAANAANALAEILVDQSRAYYSGGGKSQEEILNEQLMQTDAELKQLRQDYIALQATSPQDTGELSSLDEAIQIKESTYSTLLSQYEQARLREALRENIISIIEPAIPPTGPSKPNKLLNLALAFVAGLMGGVGLVFILENLEARLYSTDQIEIVTELTPIGKIPNFDSKGNAFLQNGNLKIKHTLFKESFRRLQTIITTQFTDKTTGKPIKTIMLTSALPGEGKSTIASNLAIAFAQSGKKTLVIDADMRLPTLHKNIGIQNEKGLSDVLSGHDNPEKLIQKTRYSNMYILTCGSIIPNAIELLSGTGMRDLVDQLSNIFDFIILDAPALLPVADATLIAGLVDGVILVTRRAYSKEDKVREACRQLGEMDAHMIGVVINGAEHNGTYYYHHSQYKDQ
jgi:non-specific protein-tyrosine kinase